MKALVQDLKKKIQGDVRFDTFSKKIYSGDASIYQIEPIGVVIPKTTEDIVAAVEIAHEQGIPVLPRGAATGITGGCLGEALVIDTSKYLHRILEINYEEEYAICEPGVIQDQLNRAVAARGYCLGPDTSTGNRATLGGMIGNNSAGAHSLRYGKTVDNVESMEVLLAGGEQLHCENLNWEQLNKKLSLGGKEGDIYRTMWKIVETHRKEIAHTFPKIQRRVSGFNLDEFLSLENFNLSKLITGSEGTLGIVTQVKVKISPKPAYTALSVVLFDDLLRSLETVEFMLESQPFSLELIDHNIIKAAKQAPAMRNQLGWLSGDPETMLVAEFDGVSPTEVQAKLATFENKMKSNGVGYAHIPLIKKSDLGKAWALRKAGLGLLMSTRTEAKAIAFLEDVAVPPAKLAPFMKIFRERLKAYGKDAGFYGHAGVGCLHVRPMLNLKNEKDLDTMIALMKETAKSLLEFGGALSGEHGDGLVRSWLNNTMFGTEIMTAFDEIKTVFDPDNRMNPGKVIRAQGPRENLKIHPKTQNHNFVPMLDFESQGGFSFSIEMCNGNGECRKPIGGVMCPSFQASGDERHSTRARAQSLRATIDGNLDFREFTGKGLYNVLDLCLECKGCKTECPSNVNMAKMKFEFLYQYQEKHGYSHRAKLFAFTDKIAKIGCFFAPFSNWILRFWGNKQLMRLIGITPKRELPAYTRKRFSTQFKRHRPVENAPKGKVVLFNDTMMEYHEPELGISALKILEKLGFEVIVPPRQCCGRPMISKGFLREARENSEKLVRLLLPYVEQGLKIVGIEPGCILTLRDDLPDLLPTKEARQIAEAAVTIDEFLAELSDKEELNLPFKKIKKDVHLHGHCHQKSLVGTAPTLKVLRSVPGFNVSEIDSGCCGMAGSFGYEKEHYDFSMTVGETRLFPAIRKTSTDSILTADGFSCRSQIKHGTGRKAKHLIEILEENLDS